MQKVQVLIVLAAAAAMASAQTPRATLQIGDPAPPLVIAKWAKGQPVSKLGHGNVDVVEFWATWCGPCKESIPHLTELAKKYKGRATFIGVDSFERIPNAHECYSKVEKFVEAFGDKMDYNVAIDSVNGVMAKTWMTAAGQPGIPTAFVIDRAGKIVWIGHPMEGLDEVVGKVVAGTYNADAQADPIPNQPNQWELMKPVSDALQAKDWRRAVIAVDALAATHAELKGRLFFDKFIALAKYDGAAAQKYGGEVAESTYKNDAQTLGSIAWMLIEDGSLVKHLDTALAIRIAERAVKLSNGDPGLQDTLALAYFRANRVSDALALQKTAVAKGSADKTFDSAQLSDMKKRLAMYLNPPKPQ